MNDRWFAGIALVLGAVVVVSEVRFWGSRSELWPVLTMIGVAIVALAGAHLARK